MSGTTVAPIQAWELSFALDGWRTEGSGRHGPTQRYDAAQGLVLALLRHSEPQQVAALHDANERKALSISPVSIQPLPGGLARASVRVGVWDVQIAMLIETALREAGDVRLHLARHAALLLSRTSIGAWTTDQMLATPAVPSVCVRFVSPTFFGYGRYRNGAARSHIVPDAGPVVASWLRAWKLTGDHSLDWLPTSPEELGTRVALIAMRNISTVVVREQTARFQGFRGECAYRWEGVEPEGRRALSMLARFAEVCGTGAKTGRGFGQTRIVTSDVSVTLGARGAHGALPDERKRDTL
jgi:hypothetical protein